MTQPERRHPFEPIVVSLTDWTDWNKHFGFSEWSDRDADAAYEAFSNTSSRDLESLIEDLWEAKPIRGRATKKRLSQEETEYLTQELKEGNEHLFPAIQAITDALTLMYEVARTPTGNDIKEAMKMASEEGAYHVISHDLWEPVLSVREAHTGPTEWSPKKKYTLSEIADQLISTASLLEKKRGVYGWDISFDFWNSPVATKLFSIVRGQKEYYERMLGEFRILAMDYIERTIRKLAAEMNGVDVSNRASFHESWKATLKSGIDLDVRRGMVEALKEMPHE